MEVKATSIPDVIEVQPDVFSDERGFFLEAYNAARYEAHGIPAAFVQDNRSRSAQGVLRGLHYQIRQAQGKLVTVLVGRVFDVAVDLRKSSPTFGEWVALELSEQRKNQLWVPVGFAHGFYVLSPWAELAYKVTDYYAPGWDRTLRWNDPQLNIDWPLIDGVAPTLSEKDAQGKPLEEAELFE
jgi:dTDP-4-dehydrorhamnose 3,5-epimerase